MVVCEDEDLQLRLTAKHGHRGARAATSMRRYGYDDLKSDGQLLHVVLNGSYVKNCDGHVDCEGAPSSNDWMT